MRRGKGRREGGKDKMRREEKVTSRRVAIKKPLYVLVFATAVESLLFESSLKHVKKLWICLGKIWLMFE